MEWIELFRIFYGVRSRNALTCTVKTTRPDSFVVDLRSEDTVKDFLLLKSIIYLRFAKSVCAKHAPEILKWKFALKLHGNNSNSDFSRVSGVSWTVVYWHAGARCREEQRLRYFWKAEFRSFKSFFTAIVRFWGKQSNFWVRITDNLGIEIRQFVQFQVKRCQYFTLNIQRGAFDCL